MSSRAAIKQHSSSSSTAAAAGRNQTIEREKMNRVKFESMPATTADKAKQTVTAKQRNTRNLDRHTTNCATANASDSE